MSANLLYETASELWKTECLSYTAAGGYLAPLKLINRSWKQLTPRFRTTKREFESREEGIANLVRGYLRRRICKDEFFGGEEVVMNAPIDVYVIGRPVKEEARLSRLFEPEPEDTDLRVLIGCMPNIEPESARGNELKRHWGKLYSNTLRSVLRNRLKNEQMGMDTFMLIEDIGEATYRSDSGRIDEILRLCGHEYHENKDGKNHSTSSR